MMRGTHASASAKNPHQHRGGRRLLAPALRLVGRQRRRLPRRRHDGLGDAVDGGPDADAASTSSLWAAKATAAPATATAPITVPGSMSTAPSGRIWLRTGLGRVYEDALKAPSKPSLKCNIFQRHPVRGTTREAEQDRTRIYL